MSLVRGFIMQGLQPFSFLCRLFSISIVPCLTLVSSAGLAQITPDDTVGTEVRPNINIRGLPSDLIEGGATRGGNLFHSFEEFNVDVGRGAYFLDSSAIENIFSRVTGSTPSNIFGTLGVLGNANLFFINPNGIVFGQNARLDVGGSFFASTADRLIFDGGAEFSASNPQSPPMLTINMPVGLGLRENPAPIQNFATVVDTLNPNTGLRVPVDQTLALVGGNVIMTGGDLLASGGRIEVGGLIGQGEVGIALGTDAAGDEVFVLNFPINIPLADVSLSQEASIDVRSAPGGSIVINANNVDLNQSRLLAGVEDLRVFSNQQTGDIEVNATGDVNLSGNSVILNGVLEDNAQGFGGDIRINAANFSAIEESGLSSSTSGQGNAGNVVIKVDNNIAFDNSNVFTTVQLSGEGQGGNIDLQGSQISLENGSQLQAQTQGTGDAGNIDVFGGESILFTGTDAEGFSSGAFSSVEPGGLGSGGNITLLSNGSITIEEGAILQVLVREASGAMPAGRGDAGVIRIQAVDQVLLDGAGSGAFSNLGTQVVNEGSRPIGRGGNVQIIADEVSVTNGAQLVASTFGQGNAGSIIINAVDPDGDIGRVVFDQGGGAFSNVEAGGNGLSAGIEISANTLEIKNGGTLQALIRSGGEGRAGDINLRLSDELRVAEEGQIVASTFGQGDAGQIVIDAPDSQILVQGDRERTQNSPFTGIFSTIEAGGVGDSEGILINADSIDIRDGARIEGVVRSMDNIAGQGNAGDVVINTREFTARRGALVDVSTFGEGNAGQLVIDAVGQVLVEGLGDDSRQIVLSSAVEPGAVGNSGGIVINADSLEVIDGAQVETLVRGGGNGNAGDIQITTNTLTVNEGSLIDVSTFGEGDAGQLIIDATGRVLLEGPSDVTALPIV
ncbi:MAG: filamentous hemagglutinin N-terminal domain-containing protein [Microcoleaceae cyanobacterium]